MKTTPHLRLGRRLRIRVVIPPLILRGEDTDAFTVVESDQWKKLHFILQECSYFKRSMSHFYKTTLLNPISLFKKQIKWKWRSLIFDFFKLHCTFSVLLHKRNLVWLFNNTECKTRVSMFNINGIVRFRERETWNSAK